MAEHAEAPLRWRAVVDDVELAAGLVRRDSIERGQQAGQVIIRLAVEDIASCPTPWADEELPPVSDVDLTPADARMLAALLVCLAERAEAAQLAGDDR